MRAVELDCWMKKDRSRKVSKFEVKKPSLSVFYLSSLYFVEVVLLAYSRPNIASMSVDSRCERIKSAKVGGNVKEVVTSEVFLDYTIKDLHERAELTFVLYDETNLEKYSQLPDFHKGPTNIKYTIHSYFVNQYKTSIEIYGEIETNVTDKGWRSDAIMHHDAISNIAVEEPKLVPLL